MLLQSLRALAEAQHTLPSSQLILQHLRDTGEQQTTPHMPTHNAHTQRAARHGVYEASGGDVPSTVPTSECLPCPALSTSGVMWLYGCLAVCGCGCVC